MARNAHHQLIDVSEGFWDLPATVTALRARDFAGLLRLVALHSGASQTQIGIAIDMSQGQVSGIMAGARRVEQLAVIERIADGLRFPDRARLLLGLAPRSGYGPPLATLDPKLGSEDDDMRRRDFLTGLGALAASRDWLLATVEEATSATGRVGSSQVEAIRRTFGVFQDMDVLRGGGFARDRLAGYLDSHVRPLLLTNSPDTPTGRELYAAGAEQLYLLGWMHFDAGDSAATERYLVEALRLAQEAQDADLGAHVLAGLSNQATACGRPAEGLKLIRAARAGMANGGRSTACQTDLLALQARAEAALGLETQALRHVAESQAMFALVDPGDEPPWAKFIDDAYLYGEWATALQGLGHPEATELAKISLQDAARQHRPRRGSFASTTLARVALDAHDLPAAAAAATEAATLAAAVTSTRSTQGVFDLRKRMVGHQNSPPVREFLEASTVLLGA